MPGVPDHLVAFVTALRSHGVAVGPGETVDAAQVITALDLLQREQLREGLAAALLRRGGERAVFDSLFELYFPVATAATGAAEPAPLEEPGGDGVSELRERLAGLLADDADGPQLRALAGQVLDVLGGTTGAGGAARWSAYQALDRLAPQTLLAQLFAGMGSRPAEGVTGELARREVRERIAGFRRLVEAEAVRRTAEQRGRDAVARSVVPRPPEQRDFLSARSDELAALRRTVSPLARRLATRLAARRRRAHRGRLDLRRTLRASMSTGGVPVRPAYRRPRPSRPELVVLCDVSGSVAGFSHFTLLLVAALAEQFSKVRVFAFVDRIDEVTELFAPGAEQSGAMARVFGEADVVHSGHSDYGGVFADFLTGHAEVVGPKTSLLVLGDGRTNHRHPESGALASIVAAARHAHWLNPEPRTDWGTGDSAALTYGRVLPMHECRTAAQLADVVAGLLPV